MEEEYYYNKDKKIILKRSKNKTAFKKNVSGESGIAGEMSALNQNNIIKTEKDDGVRVVMINQGEGFNALGENNNDIGDNAKLNVYEKDEIETMILTDEFIIRFKDDATEEKVNSIINNDKFEFKKQELGVNRYLGKIKSMNDYKNILNIINDINKLEYVDYAQPNFKRITKLLSVPNDARFEEQWALNSVDKGINVSSVWEKGIKGKNIKIAIVDTGIDINHEDLMNNGQPVDGFDVIYGTQDPRPVNSDSHGTKCAGIAAARGNNNEIGICGVAPESDLIGIRIASENIDGTWHNPNNDDDYANGILKAVSLNADVISNSWYYDDDSSDIEYALQYARDEGRNRKGCVVIFASGNYIKDIGNGDLSVSNPAKLKRLVIAVGAYNESGNWVGDKQSEKWASRYGPELKLCAPGFNILTTKYYIGNVNDSQKYGLFSGTSAAAPIVAGVAALMLCANPNLKATEVEKILLDTADRIISNDPEKTGAGKVNAKNAVDKALGN